MTLPPDPCVVTTVSVPQAVELHPGPDRAHDKFVLGLEPGTGVNVATIEALLPAGTLCGAVICSVNLLVMLIGAEACFDGSATLCAVRVADAGAGRICGAV